MENRLYKLSAKSIASNIKSKKITVHEIVLSCLKRIDKIEGKVKAWAFLDKGIFLNQAKAKDRKIRTAEQLGRLIGVPIGVKDIFNTHDMPTCMGSPLWKDFMPGNDARTVFNLRQEDALIAGKTVTAEFAVHEPGPTRNPHNLDYYPGTSSSGSAVAVITGMVPVALGTQTAGSIIRPASYCGVYGFKPSFGLIPRTGVLKTNDTLDQIGWFARNIEDIELLFDVLRVKGLNYPYVNRYIDRKPPGTFLRKVWKVAFVEHPKWNYADSYAKKDFIKFKEALSELKCIKVKEKNLPQEFNKAHQIHDVIYNKTLSYYFKEEYKKRNLVSKILCELVAKGKKITIKEYNDALAGQALLIDKLNGFFKDLDIVITLSTSGEAPKFPNPVDKPDSCLIWNLCGTPAINVPIFKGPKGLPFGIQIVANRYKDILLLNFVKLLQEHGFAKTAPIVEVE